MMKTMIGILFVLALGSSSGAWAQETKVNDREQPIQNVFQAVLVYPQEKGEVELALQSSFSKMTEGDEFRIPLGIEYGITDAWQVELEWDSYVHRKAIIGETANGVGDLEIGMQYSFMEIAESNYHVALGLEAGFPTGDGVKGLGSGETQYGSYLVIAKDFEKLNNSQFFAQIIVEVEGDETELSWNAGFFVPLGRPVFSTEYNMSEQQAYLMPGLIWNIPKGWELGFALALGLDDKSDDYRIIARVNYEFELFDEDN